MSKFVPVALHPIRYDQLARWGRKKNLSVIDVINRAAALAVKNGFISAVDGFSASVEAGEVKLTIAGLEVGTADWESTAALAATFKRVGEGSLPHHILLYPGHIVIVARKGRGVSVRVVDAETAHELIEVTLPSAVALELAREFAGAATTAKH